MAEPDADDGVLLRLEVEDTGIGIDEGKMATLFAAFEQGDRSTTRKYGGHRPWPRHHRRLARMMGGEPVSIAVPASAAASGSPHGCAGAVACHPRQRPIRCWSNLWRSWSAARSGARVLLVEDNAINREVATELLQAIGLQVDLAENGRQALERVPGANYDLILMDMQMPELDGVEATRAIRALPGGASLPIIAMTANAFDDDRQRCFAAGMNDFITKPVDPARLHATLLKWLPVRSNEPQTAATTTGDSAESTESALRQRLGAHSRP
jgi:two-component system sensor histidine kinase/response regulator